MPAFRLLTAGQFTSTIGDYCYAVVLPWLVLSHHSSAASLGVVLACYGVPRALLTVPGGSLADRFGPRLVMLVSDVLRCALTSVFTVFTVFTVFAVFTVFTVLAVSHGSSLAAVAPVSAALGACSALFLPASLTLMPSLIEDAKLASANAFYTGFLQAGSVLALIGRGVARQAQTKTRPGPGEATQGKSTPEEAVREEAVPEPAGATATAEVPVVVSVWALLRRERLLRIVLLVSVTANFALTGTTEVTLPALAHPRYGAAGFGAVLACIAVMGVIGALIVAWAGERVVRATLIAGGFQVAAVAIVVAPFLGGLPGLAVGLSVFGLALGFDNAVWATLIQRWAPPELLGWVWGVLMLAPVCSFPFSTLAAGFLTRHLGPTPVFPIAGALLALSYLFGLSHREFRELGRTG